MASILQAEKERQRREVVDDIARRQKQLEERQLAEARRVAELDRQRRDAAIVQAVEKQQQDDNRRKLAESQQREQDEKARLADAEGSLELERQRQAAIVQASVRERELAEERDLAAKHAAESGQQTVQLNTQPTVMSAQTRAAEPAKPVAKVAAKPIRKAAPRKSARGAPVIARRGGTVRTAGRRVGHAAHSHDPIARMLAELCPLRWLDTVLTELSSPRRFG